jgi:hypothetical protein
LHSSSTNEESNDETNSLIIPFEGALRENGDKKAMECPKAQNLGGTKGRSKLKCNGKCAQKPFKSPKFPQNPHGATQPSHNGLRPSGNCFVCGGIYLEWGSRQAHHQSKIV